MGAFLAEWLESIWFVLAESGPYLLVGFLLAGLLKVLIPERWIVARMGRDDLRSAATASLLGVPIPLCSCSVIPTATQLRRGGASKGATTSFLISTPETGVDSIGVTWALIDPLMTVVRPIAAFLTALLSGTAVNALVRRGLDDRPEPAASPDAACCHETPTEGLEGEAHDHAPVEDDEGGNVLTRATRYGFGPLLADLAPWFVLGFLLSGLIVVLVPDDFFAGAMLSGWTAMLVMLAAGTPLYVCATASTPIAAALMAKGLPPGAALVLLLAGPATNVATILIVRDLLGKRILAVYLASIVVASLALGALVDFLYPLLGFDPGAVDVRPGTMEHGLVANVSGLVLLVLLVRSVWSQRVDRSFGAWLRRVGRPIGLDPTAAPVKAVAVLALVLAYASSALTVVRAGETAFLVRFGELRATWTEPGVHVHAPWPFARAERVPTTLVRGFDFGFDRDASATAAMQELALREASEELERLADQAEVLTGDEAVLSVEFATHVRVKDARRWRYGHEEPQRLVEVLTEAALREAASRRHSEELLVGDRVALEREVASDLQAQLDRLEAGADVVAVRVIDAHAPPDVHASYRDVASAHEDALAEVLLADRFRTELLAEAHSTAVRERATAAADKAAALADARGRALAFTALDAVMSEHGDAASFALWREAAREALAGVRLILVADPDVRVLSRGAGALPASPPDLFDGAGGKR